MKVTYTLTKENLFHCNELMVLGTDEAKETLKKQKKKLYMMGLIPVAVGLFAIARISTGSAGKVPLLLLLGDLAVAGMIYYMGFRYEAVVRRNLLKNLDKHWSMAGPVPTELDVGENSLVVEADGQTSIFYYSEFQRRYKTDDCLCLVFSGGRIICIPKTALSADGCTELYDKLEMTPEDCV